MTAELTDLNQKHKTQPRDVLRAYLCAKAKLQDQGLPVVADTGKKDFNITGYALNAGLLKGLTGKEIEVYRWLLKGLPFQYRSHAAIAKEAGVSIATVKRCITKLKRFGLIACHGRSNKTSVIAFTDTDRKSVV